MRLPEVLEVKGSGRSTTYQEIKDKKFPAGVKLNPEGRIRVWFEDEVAAWQRGEWFPGWQPAGSAD
jgi:predicted DNA-binding transcriptional regulator AlpA